VKLARGCGGVEVHAAAVGDEPGVMGARVHAGTKPVHVQHPRVPPFDQFPKRHAGAGGFADVEVRVEVHAVERAEFFRDRAHERKREIVSAADRDREEVRGEQRAGGGGDACMRFVERRARRDVAGIKHARPARVGRGRFRGAVTREGGAKRGRALRGADAPAVELHAGVVGEPEQRDRAAVRRIALNRRGKARGGNFLRPRAGRDVRNGKRRAFHRQARIGTRTRFSSAQRWASS